MSEINNDIIFKAFHNIFHDTEPKFDACLIERFLESVKDKFCASPISEKKFELDIKPLLDNILDHMKHEDYSTLNRPRIFEAIEILSRDMIRTKDSLEKMIPYLNQLWSSISIVIQKTDQVSMRFILTMFESMLGNEEYFHWLVKQRIEDLEVREVQDLPTLARYVIETTNNYHTKSKSIVLMETLLLKGVDYKLEDNHPTMIVLKHIINEMVKKNNQSIHGIIRHVVNENSDDDIYEIKKILSTNWQKLVMTNDNIVGLCKTLGSFDVELDSNELIKKFRDLDKLEEIMVFIASGGVKNVNLLMNSFLGPIVLSCCHNLRESNQEINNVLAKLHMSEDERAYLNKNVQELKFQNKILKPCFVHLTKLFEDENIQVCLEEQTDIALFVKVTIESLTLFVESNLGSNRNQYLHLALAALEKSMRMYTSGDYKELCESILMSPFHTLSLLKGHTNCHRPTVFYLLRIIIDNYARIHRKKLQSTMQLESYFMKIVDLAYDFEDAEVLNEIALLFVTTPFEFTDYSQEQVKIYVILIWEHMYQKAKNTTHREFLGCVAQLLLMIDLEAPVSILDECNLRRHHEIPNLVGEILREYAPVVSTISRILECLVGTSVSQDNTSNDEFINYVQYIDSPNLPSTVKPNLDNLLYGITVAMHSEIEEVNLEKCIKLICGSVTDMLLNYSDPYYLLKRLIRTDILDTLYDCCTNKEYGSAFLYEKALSKIQPIQLAITKRLENPQETIRTSFKKQTTIDDDRIEKLVSFYTEECCELTKLDSQINFSVEEPLVKDNNYQEALDEIMQYEDIHVSLDCY